MPSIAAVQPVHVAGYIEELTRERSAPTAKQRLAAIRHLFDWLVVGQVMPVNPASSVRGPSHVVKRGKTPVLSPEEARRVLDSDRREHARRLARSRADRAHGVFVRAHRRGARHEGRGRVRAEPPAMGAVAREGRQARTKCRATTILRHICTPISTAAGSPPIPRGRCFAPSAARPGSSPDSPAPAECPRHDPPARRRRRHQDPGRQSHLPGDRASPPI